MTDTTSPHHPEFSPIEATIKEVAEMNVTQNTLDGVTSRVLQALQPTANVLPLHDASKSSRRVIVAIAVASLSVVAAVFVASLPGSSMAFAQTQRQVEKTQTVQYVEYMHEVDVRREIREHQEYLKESDAEMTEMAKDNDRSAEEISALQNQMDAIKQELSYTIMKLEAALKSGKPIEHRRVWIQGRYLQRVEQSGILGKHIYISNAKTGEQVSIDPATKVFTRLKTQTVLGMKSGEKSVSNLEPHPEADFYAAFSAISTAKLSPLLEKQMNGVTVLGFQATDATPFDTFLHTFWINKATKLPVRIDALVTRKETVVGGHSQRDFVFDAPLAPELFSTEPPAGYTVRDGSIMGLDPAK